ncbi:ankyrin repeat domain protein [Nitzschia inconspicua]|uniref:Ankyrin repeat domain protein n=1 Tax=Nitzschia inconspicua TaxID=303405 RepID=A0A9K3KI05_9STRA|nr:ankyrin repeat domain protein [Nitzschia inconspicua]
MLLVFDVQGYFYTYNPPCWAATGGRTFIEKRVKCYQFILVIQHYENQLCLAGEEFKRCAIDTLFYVVGSPGKYQIKKRPVNGVINEEEDGICLSLKSCKEADVAKLLEAKLAKCSHCGAKNWNIVGDSETGYVLTESDGKTCLVREAGTKKAMTAPCDSTDIPYVPLQLQFASATDIQTMSSDGARLVGAASDGDKKAIQALLKEGVDINVRDWDELTALIPAASSGNLDICKLLVKEGIDVNAKDKDGITALMEASIMGHEKVVEFLISSGANVNAAASSEVTALWLAASEGRVEVMKLLLKKKADASNSRVDGITALITASASGHTEAVKLLLENGADPTTTDNDGLTALMNAAENGNVDTLKAIMEKVNDSDYINRMSNTGFTALIIASAHGHVDAVEYLVGAGADVDAVHENKVTALMYAAAAGHLDVMKILIDKGKADLEFKHTNGGTALLEASTAGKYEAIQLLVQHGSKVDFFDDDGVNPLMAIAAQGNFESQTFILEELKKTKSAAELTDYINRFAHSGGSAVMFAAAGGHVECAKQLMDLGSDINAVARNKPGYLEKLRKMIEEGQVQEDEPHVDGVTAIHVAAQGGHLEMVKVLVEAGVEPSLSHLDDAGRSPLVLAVQGNYGEAASVLVQAGSDPNTPYIDNDGEKHNLLFDAIMVENEEFALLLIEKGADIYFTDEKNVSTLLQASHRGLPAVVKALLEKHDASGRNKAFVDVASDDGITPLIAASSEGNTECVSLLIASKADVNAKDKDGTNSLMAASARGHLDVVTALLAAGSKVNDQNADGHTALMFAYNGKNQVETLWERYNQFVLEAESNGEAKEDVDDNGTGPIIQDALKNHTSLVDLLIKNGADQSLKDKEGHVAQDFDFHPDTDAEILAKESRASKLKDESKNEL